MVLVPENGVTQADIEQWYYLHQEKKRITASEMLLRKKIFGALFPNAVEGTNKHDLGDGYFINAQFAYTREIDPGALQAYREKLVELKVNPEKLINYKPSLVKSQYNLLTQEQKDAFDNVLIIKPGSPTLDIVKPKRGATANPILGEVNEQ